MNRKTVETLGVQIGDIVEVTIDGRFFEEGNTNIGFVRTIHRSVNAYKLDTSWYEIVPFGRTAAVRNSPTGDSFKLSILDYGVKWQKKISERFGP
jgi:hypothetical protein